MRIWTDDEYPWPGLESHVIQQLRDLLGAENKDKKQPSTLSFAPEEFPFAPPITQDSIAVDLRLPPEDPTKPLPILELKDKDKVISEAYQKIISELLSDISPGETV